MVNEPPEKLMAAFAEKEEATAEKEEAAAEKEEAAAASETESGISDQIDETKAEEEQEV